MRQKFFIFAALFLLIIILVGLNAASYVQKEKQLDSEFAPNRSTFNAGATGTRAFYDLLAETGRKPTRWQEPMSALLINDKNKPQTFIIVGRTRREFDDKEIEQLLRWVSEGGKLVIIDREPPGELIKTTADWSVSNATEAEPPFFDFDPSNVKQMTEKTVAAKPTQPTIYTDKVNAVQPSRFASSISFEHFTGGDSVSDKIISAPPKAVVRENEDYDEDAPPDISFDDALKKVQTKKIPETEIKNNGIASDKSPALIAPVVHLASNDKTLLADFPFGSGQIVFLTDPYIISNGGISLVDNAQLAINVVASREGIVAFDEFHQGFGAGQNRFLDYFAGTPVIAIFLQIAALAAVVLFTQSRRFARPLPADEPNRLSKLEYVAAMAELQQRTKAFDLAIENIYTDFRRRASRLVGADNFAVSHQELAKLIAERGGFDPNQIENLMFKCEEIIRGEPTNKREVLALTSRLREVEEKLGLKRQRAARK